MNLTNHSHEAHGLLLTFAHRGEARAFLQEFKTTQLLSGLYLLDTPYSGLNVFLLISGEGFEDSLTSLAFVLGKYPEIKEIINYGVCGLLRKNSSLEISDLVAIRTVYADSPNCENDKMSFKSFTLESKGENALDVVSTHERILSDKQASFLDSFAPLVDRELWAQAFAAQKLGIKLSSFKVISDYADGKICQQVKEEAPLWSDKLLRHFIKYCESPAKTQESEQSFIEEFLKNSQAFHITLSQERALEHILQAHHIKGNTFSDLKEKIGFSKLELEKKRPKDKTKDLIAHLSEALNPLETKIKRELAQFTYGLEKLGAQVKHDQDLDKARLHLSITLQTQDDFKRVAQALESFPFEDWSKVLRGGYEDV